MKRVMKLFFIMILPISILFSATTLNIVESSVNAGATFWLEINIDNDENFSGYQCDISFPSSFSYDDEAVQSSREDGHTFQSSEQSGTEVRLLCYSMPATAFEGSTGTVASVKFQAPSSSGSYSFTLNEVSISDMDAADICDSFSGATITVSEAPTPIELSTFIAEMTSKGIKLTWETASETENSHFLIYRDDEVIGQVEGAGTTSEQHSYTYLDTRTRGGIHNYAIADVSYGGVEKLHDAVSVEVGASISEASFILNKAYPNPFNPSTAISYRLSAISYVDLSIFDTNGNKIARLFTGEQTVGQHQVIWNAEGLPSGTYIAKMSAGDEMQTQKLVLVK